MTGGDSNEEGRKVQRGGRGLNLRRHVRWFEVEKTKGWITGVDLNEKECFDMMRD